MDRTHSFSGGQKASSASGEPFGYQQRLLARTSSRAGGTLTRSGSQTANTILNNPTGARRWTPGHRVGQSLDVVKGKLEERTRSESVPEQTGSSTDTKLESSSLTDSPTSTSDTGFRSRYAELLARTPTRRSTVVDFDNSSTPISSKRYTLPDPIIAAPLSPNTTGVTIESPDESPSASDLHRIRLPVASPLNPSPKRHSQYSVPLRDDDTPDSPSSTRFHRARALEALDAASTGSSTTSDATSSSSLASSSSRTLFDTPSSTNLNRRPTSLYGGQYSTTSSPTRYPFTPRPRSHTASARTSPAPESPSKQDAPASSTASTSTTASTVMTPKPYRSSYMNSKTSKLPDYLTAGRRLGRHLPRIASGEVHDDFPSSEKVDEEPPPPAPKPEPRDDWQTRRAERARRAQSEGRIERPPFADRPSSRDSTYTGVGEGEDVAGMRGRLRLSRDMTPSTPASPLPSSRLTRGLWADVQRHLLQAYEYLCHVGEAQQWIEGCLGKELPFGVVEMEERMRDGVVLAKLVCIFQGEGAVRIYEASNIPDFFVVYWLTLQLQAPRLNFRHSDNINAFFNFVRHVGLPEVGIRFFLPKVWS